VKEWIGAQRLAWGSQMAGRPKNKAHGVLEMPPQPGLPSRSVYDRMKAHRTILEQIE